MKRKKTTKKSNMPIISDEKLREWEEFMNGGSKEAEQFKEELQRTIDQHRRDTIHNYKFNKKMYEDCYERDIEADEEFDDIPAF